MSPRVSWPIDDDEGQDLGNEAAFRRTMLIATAALWTANWALLNLRSHLEGASIFWEVAIIRAGLCLAGAFICYILHLVLRQLGNRKFRYKVMAAALLAPVAADAYAWVNQLTAEFFYGPLKPASAGQTLLAIIMFIWLFFAWSTLYLGVDYSSRASIQDRRWSRLRELAQAAQLQALRYQINPHFLFNTLNSISALILDRKTAEAEEMVRRLSDFFRGTLSVGNVETVSLREELDLQRSYLAIEQVRFPDLEVQLDVSKEALKAAVPALLLQPIVENAVKFGAAASRDPSRISISGYVSDGRLTLTVVDDGLGAKNTVGTGLGLANVRSRLEARYGELASLSVMPRQPRGFAVKLNLPFEAAA